MRWNLRHEIHTWKLALNCFPEECNDFLLIHNSEKCLITHIFASLTIEQITISMIREEGFFGFRIFFFGNYAHFCNKCLILGPFPPFFVKVWSSSSLGWYSSSRSLPATIPNLAFCEPWYENPTSALILYTVTCKNKNMLENQFWTFVIFAI